MSRRLVLPDTVSADGGERKLIEGRMRSSFEPLSLNEQTPAPLIIHIVGRLFPKSSPKQSIVLCVPRQHVPNAGQVYHVDEFPMQLNRERKQARLNSGRTRHI